MKLTCWLCAIFAMIFAATLLCSTPAMANTPATTTPQATLPSASTNLLLGQDGHPRTLWAHFIAQKQPRSAWPKFWKDACALTNKHRYGKEIPCTDRAWKKLPVGFVVAAPLTPPEVARAHMQAVNMLLLGEVDALRDEIAFQKKRNQVLEQELASMETVLTRVIYTFMGLAVLCAIGMIHFWNHSITKSLKLRNAELHIKELKRETPIVPDKSFANTIPEMILPPWHSGA